MMGNLKAAGLIATLIPATYSNNVVVDPAKVLATTLEPTNETSIDYDSFVTPSSNFTSVATSEHTKEVMFVDCVSDIREFDSRVHKRKYRVGVHAIRGFDAAFDEYNTTFGEYLTATAGRRFDPPIEFEMVPVTFQGLFDAVEEEEIDFFYANPGIYSCVGVEQGAQALATIISHLEVRGHSFDLDVFGGVIFAQAENYEINSIHDLKNKIIGAGGISMIMAAQLQFYEMEMAGMSYVMDPKQVVFTYNQFDVVNGVLNGEFDVGFVRTDTIERTKDKDGNQVDPDDFKIIQPHTYVLDDGNLFPFLHSTDIYPEWPVSALTHVAKDVSEEVQEALLAISAHSKVGKLLLGCEEPCDISKLKTRCDTTKEIALLAYEGTVRGKIAGFRTARSYFEVRTMHEAGGFIIKDDKGNWKCTRASTVYDGITCPSDHYKLSKAEFDRSCGELGLKCKTDMGYECFCKPCVKAFEVDVYQHFGGEEDDHKGCSKMSLCGSVQQTKNITFRVKDNKQREGARVFAVMHLGRDTEELVVHKVENVSWTYEFQWSERELGVGILEVYIDGIQIPESPIRVQVVERACHVEYPGQEKVSDGNGECVCRDGTVEFHGICLSSTIIAVVSSVAVILIIAQLIWLGARYRNIKNDQLWHVSVDELQFDDPVEVIGQGSFGVVLLAEYRGTKVAIKRALKATYNRGSSKYRSRSRNGSKGSKRSQGASTKSTTRPGDMNGFSVRDISAEQECSEDPDVESPPDSGEAPNVEESRVDHSLGFLAVDFGNPSRWAWLFPWLKQKDYQSRFKESILGGSSTSNQKRSMSLSARIFPCFDAQSVRREEFVCEMRLLSRLRHPCITTVMGAVMTHSNDPMLVMEYMEYGSLYDLLRNETMILSGDIILPIMRDIAQGLRFLHTSKPPILHGDMKGKNILIDARFRAKVCDFGLATKSKSMITGTPYWLAPEYLRGQTSYNSACDVYSVGIILFEIFSRTNPYEGENFKEVLRKVCDRRVNKRPPIPRECPPKVVDLMKKCWSPDPIYRPQAKELDMMLMEMTTQDAEPLIVDDHHDDDKEKSGDMLYDLFPRYIAKALKAGQKLEPEDHEMVTVVFSDIIRFTDISKELSPMKVSNMLDRLYQQFDRIARKHDVFKVETVGDAYMGVANLEDNQNDTHVKHIAEFAIDMVSEANKILIDEEDESKGFINIRVGFHSGPVVTDVIGTLNPRYGLFGDTVNTASRMESNSKGNRILCSEKSYKLLIQQAPEIPVRKRGKIYVKGKGDMNTFWVGVGSTKNNSDGAGKTKKTEEKRVGFQSDIQMEVSSYCDLTSSYGGSVK